MTRELEEVGGMTEPANDFLDDDEDNVAMETAKKLPIMAKKNRERFAVKKSYSIEVHMSI